MEEYSIYLFIAIGFIAQIVDGGLGMGFGVFSNTALLGFGVPPAKASKIVHSAEVVTSGIASFFHWKNGNVDKKLFRRLAVFGSIGGAIGAYLLANISANAIKPFISIYLLVLGCFILQKAFKKFKEEELDNRFFRIGVIGRSILTMVQRFRGSDYFSPIFSRVLGFAGGFLDAIGGGGWGPIVTSTLVVKNPEKIRYVIGSSCAAEFFVTFVTSLTFWITLQSFVGWDMVFGLMIGGAIAAPASAFLCRKIPPRILLFSVGLMIIAVSLFNLYKSGLFHDIGASIQVYTG